MKGHPMRLLVLSLLVLIVSGCMRYDFQKYQSIDQTAKTITVEPGGSGLKGKLKQALISNGWSTAIDKGPSVIEGSAKEQVRLEAYNTFKTRYRLYVNSHQFDWCILGGAAIRYDVSMVDNLNGNEVFTMSGRGCEPDVIEQFIQKINGEVD
jgi:hypothetical protein